MMKTLVRIQSELNNARTIFLAAVFVYEVRHSAEPEEAGSNPDAALTRGPFWSGSLMAKHCRRVISRMIARDRDMAISLRHEQ